MYFTCSTMKSLMKVVSCEASRTAKKMTCRTCKLWETETTDPANTKTKEEVESAWEQAGIAPEPVRFDQYADGERHRYIGKGRKIARAK